MPRTRLAVLALLLLAIAGALALWLWQSGGEPGPVTPPPADPAAAAVGASPETPPPPPPAAATPATGESERVAAGAASGDGSTTTGTLRVTALWPDRSPATGVMIVLRRSVPRLPYTAFARAVTGTDGVVEFAGAPLGPSSLASDRRDRMKVDVEGGHQEVTFELKGGVAVRGAVHDPDGSPVAGADVWLQSSGTTWTDGRVVTTTDAGGEFALEHVNPAQSLGAVASGFSPSRLVDLDVVDTSAPPAVVTLELRPDGGRLAGTVTDADGEPVADAVVAVGTRPRHLDYRGDRVVEQWTVRTADTGEDGSFAIDGLATGTHPVTIRGAGYGLWRDEAAIRARETTVIAPRLLPAATLSGTVTDGDGNPLHEAAVRVYDREPRTSFLAGGQIDFDETFGYRAAITAPDGTYRVDGVTPGTAWVFAQRHHDRRKRDGVSVAYTRAELQVDPGADAKWDPVIADGRSIEGIVYYADGFPIPRLFVTLADEKEGGMEHVIVSSGEGVFRFLCLEDSTYEIRVQAPFDAPKGAPPIKTSGVIPDRGRTELRATYDKPVKQEPGVVIGRVDDAAGRIGNVNAATITLHSDARWFRPGIAIEDGAFEIDRVKPCRFRLVLKEEDAVLAESDWFEMKPAATVDTGVLITEPAGGVRFTVKRDPGTEAFEPTLYLRRGKGSSTRIGLGRRTELLADNLTPGDYTISGYHKGMVSLNSAVSVVAGSTAEVELRLRAGAPVRCEVWWPPGDVESTSHKYRIFDGDGKLQLELGSGLHTMPTHPYPLRYTLPPGRWRIEFTTDDGLSGEVEFDVENATDAVEPRIDLK